VKVLENSNESAIKNVEIKAKKQNNPNKNFGNGL
jgi:hypothetical protein